ncbi:hypothetical protein [Virgibacillus salexigens]|nr:hypothetical protein [Virgibacillus salexigens]
MEQKILEILTELQKEQQEQKEFRQEVRNEFKALNDKLDLLTKQIK